MPKHSKHASQYTRKYKPSKLRVSRPTPRPLPRPFRLPRVQTPVMQEPPHLSNLSNSMTTHIPTHLGNLSNSYMTNRIQRYLGTHVPPYAPFVSANRLATMPQNYYNLDPKFITRQMIRQNFSGNGLKCEKPLPLPEFKRQLEQLYYKNNLEPIPMQVLDEDEFNYRMVNYEQNRAYMGPSCYDPPFIKLQMNLPFPNRYMKYDDE
jgi:hypothetical protein